MTDEKDNPNMTNTTEIEVLPAANLAPVALNPAQTRHEQLEDLRAEAQFLEIAVGLAEKACSGQLVAAHFRGKPADGAIAIAYGSSLGWHWTKSLQDVFVVNGKPAIQSKEMRELLIRAGHEIWEEEVGPARVVLAGRRRGSDIIVRVEWTMEKAEQAKLTSNPNYAKFPENMLYARATTDLAKRLAPDALSGLGIVEELQDMGYGALPPRQPGGSGLAGVRAARQRAQDAAASAHQDTGPPADEPAGQPQPYDPDQVSPPDDPHRRKFLNKMFALFAKADIAQDNRDDRLIVTRRIAGRAPGGAPIESANDLTDRELVALVSELGNLDKAGQLGARITEWLNEATLAEMDTPQPDNPRNGS